MTFRDPLKCLGLGVFLFLSACSTSVPEMPADESSHLSTSPTLASNEEIPSVVADLPMLSQPQAQAAPELYSVVAQNQAVRDILFAMARDASTNIDIHPSITGQISINAIDQTLPQILDRLANQVDLRWSYDANGNLLVEPDVAYWQVYSIDYVNVEREASTTVSVSNTIVNVGSGAGIAGNNSSASITQSSSNSFWETLTTNLTVLLDQNATEASSTSVIANPESGIININANSKQHAQIAAFIDQVHNRALQEVMIEATIVEVSLNDSYQAGVDWNVIGLGGDVNSVPSTNLGGTSISELNNILTISADDITGQVELLEQFGDLRVLSSPRIMALNNQAAMLRAVDNEVYFSIDVQPAPLSTTGAAIGQPTYSTEIHTVPVGFVMTITPQIGDNNQITLNVRPTISRVVRFANDPNPDLADANVENPVPVIQVREMESILKVFSGQIAVLGGLMQDSLEQNTSGLPGVSRIPGVRNLFSTRKDTSKKTELIVFIRPVLVNEPSISGDLDEYQNYLPESNAEFFDQNSYQQPLN